MSGLSGLPPGLPCLIVVIAAPLLLWPPPQTLIANRWAGAVPRLLSWGLGQGGKEGAGEAEGEAPGFAPRPRLPGREEQGFRAPFQVLSPHLPGLPFLGGACWCVGRDPGWLGPPSAPGGILLPPATPDHRHRPSPNPGQSRGCFVVVAGVPGERPPQATGAGGPGRGWGRSGGPGDKGGESAQLVLLGSP